MMTMEHIQQITVNDISLTFDEVYQLKKKGYKMSLHQLIELMRQSKDKDDFFKKIQNYEPPTDTH